MVETSARIATQNCSRLSATRTDEVVLVTLTVAESKPTLTSISRRAHRGEGVACPSASAESVLRPPGRCHVTKVLRCADLMPDCKTVIVGKDADEVFAKAEAHARKEHNMMIIPPSVMSQIEAAIKDKT